MTDPTIGSVLARTNAFEKAAHEILSKHESAPSRVVILEDTYAALGRLTLRQDDLIRQALRCAEEALFRAAHVMAWAGFVDFLYEKLGSDGLVKLRAARPKWTGKDIWEMSETLNERQFVDACQPIGLADKNEVKRMVSLLDRRNQCAHPTSYYPDLNMTLGYVSEVLHLIKDLQPRKL